jgi:F-box and leucine-rich repeat protein 2/20
MISKLKKNRNCHSNSESNSRISEKLQKGCTSSSSSSSSPSPSPLNSNEICQDNQVNFINNKLPKELLVRCFSYLDVITLSRCAQVCKYWNSLALDGSNWQYIDLFEFQTDINGCVIENLSKRCNEFLKALRLENCRWINDDAIQTLCINCPNIEVINLKQCLNLTDKGFTSIGNCLSRLVDINLDSCLITEDGLDAISNGCPLLESIDISWCKFLSVNSLLRLFRHSCQNLKFFNARGVTSVINDAILQQIALKCSNLVYLNLFKCSVIKFENYYLLINPN